MKKTPAPLKWITENRARTAHKLSVARHRASLMNDLVDKLVLDLESLDTALRLYAPSLKPASIQPINAWTGRYGRHGGLKGTIVQILQAHAPAWVPMDRIEDLVRSELAIEFYSAVERRNWYMGSFRRALLRMQEAGTVESRYDAANPSALGQWRWKQEKQATLAELRAAGDATVG